MIVAGPGRFRRRAGQVDTARQHRDETARRWADLNLPTADATDHTVHVAAARAVARALRPDLDHHSAEAARHDQTAAAHDLAVERRNGQQDAVRAANQHNTARRQQALEQLDPTRAAAVRALELRDDLVAGMPPTEVVGLDHARRAHLHQNALQEQSERAAAVQVARRGCPAARTRRQSMNGPDKPWHSNSSRCRSDESLQHWLADLCHNYGTRWVSLHHSWLK